MNGKGHTGLALGTGVVYLACRASEGRTYGLAEVVALFFGTWCGGKLPDWLEPACNPRHRGPAHSMTVGALAASCLRSVSAEVREHPPGSFWSVFREFIGGVALGYMSHLGADMLTADGLPWLDRGFRLSLHAPNKGW